MAKITDHIVTGVKVAGIPYSGMIHLFWCPGCNSHMWFNDARWEWNGDRDKPTVTPSIRSAHCHVVLVRGRIHFYPDCEHELAGKSIEMTAEEEL
jgi:hypothetical protein